MRRRQTNYFCGKAQAGILSAGGSCAPPSGAAVSPVRKEPVSLANIDGNNSLCAARASPASSGRSLSKKPLPKISRKASAMALPGTSAPALGAVRAAEQNPGPAPLPRSVISQAQTQGVPQFRRGRAGILHVEDGEGGSKNTKLTACEVKRSALLAAITGRRAVVRQLKPTAAPPAGSQRWLRQQIARDGEKRVGLVAPVDLKEYAMRLGMDPAREEVEN